MVHPVHGFLQKRPSEIAYVLIWSSSTFSSKIFEIFPSPFPSPQWGEGKGEGG
jgi:hypothetical protein